MLPRSVAFFQGDKVCPCFVSEHPLLGLLMSCMMLKLGETFDV